MNRLTHWILNEASIFALELALVAALAISLAYWTWVAISPATVAAPMLSAGPSSGRPEQLASGNLFGAPSAGVATGPRSAGAGFTLVGVFSGERPGEGRAIFGRQSGPPASVATGESITSGVTLHEVHPDHVIILRNGLEERIDLERRLARPLAPTAKPPAQVQK
jgi:general secretion pathway protein C